MPKTYDQFTYRDMDEIRIAFESAFINDLNSLVGSIRHVRIDKSPEYFVLEYRKLTELTVDLPNVAPSVSINIKNDFSCIVVGLNSEDEGFVKSMVLRYLRSNGF